MTPLPAPAPLPPYPLTPQDALRNTLIRVAAKAAQRRFTGEPVTGFGGL